MSASPLACLASAEAALIASLDRTAQLLDTVGTSALELALARVQHSAAAAQQRLEAAVARVGSFAADVLGTLQRAAAGLLADVQANALPPAPAVPAPAPEPVQPPAEPTPEPSWGEETVNPAEPTAPQEKHPAAEVVTATAACQPAAPSVPPAVAPSTSTSTPQAAPEVPAPPEPARKRRKPR